MSLCREGVSSEAAPVKVTMALHLKAKCKRVGRGFAGQEVQELTGERKALQKCSLPSSHTAGSSLRSERTEELQGT